MSKQDNRFDVAIIGSGPAGMQATLVLARTRKKIVVFDDPRPARNAASRTTAPADWGS
jgi:thioredoxin reductase